MVGNLTHQGETGFVASVVCLSIMTVAVVLRFWCKAVSKAGIHADDWWILLTVISWAGADTAVIWGLLNGSGGKEMPEIMAELLSSPSPDRVRGLENYLESLWISYLISLFSFWTIKISVLLFYRRIFSTPRFRTVCLIVMGIATAWYISAEVSTFCVCSRIDGFWHPLSGANCPLNFNLFSFLIGIFEIVIDVCIIIMPLRILAKLNMPLKSKVLAAGIFILSGFAIVTNIIRLRFQYQPHTQFVRFNNTTFWLNVHAATNVVCACLPVYGPIRAQVAAILTSLRDKYGSRSSLLSNSGRNKTSKKSGGIPDSNDVDLTNMDAGYHDTSVRYPSRGSSRELVLSPHEVMHATVVGRGKTGQPEVVPPQGIARTMQVEVV